MREKFIILAGQRFGKLTVLYRTNDYISPSGQHKKVWHCKCDCGKEKDVKAETLKSGDTKSCGCFQQESRGKSLFKDVTGQKFGKLTVLYKADDYISPKGERKVQWHCKCNCGKEYDKTLSKLKSASLQKNGGCNCNCITFADAYPKIASEWHPTKNGILKPTDVLPKSHKKVWWKCPRGHEYQNSIRQRTSLHINCPICGKEKKTSFSEQAIYYYIKKYFNDAENTNKNAIGMELDIFIPSKRIAIEYDGAKWHQNNKYEEKKNFLCKANNIKLLRVRENGLKMINDCICIFKKQNNNQSLSETIIQIFDFIDKKIQVDINIDRDTSEIYALYVKSIKKNNLFLKFPELSKEWNYERNGLLNPEMFSSGSSKKVWWKCSSCGNEWQAFIYSRSKGCGCPFCGFKKTGSKNSKKVAMFSSKTNIILKTFNSITEASEKTGISYPTIISKCKGFSSSKDDFYWKYI